MIHKSTDIANVVASLSNPEIGDIISNLKLQKLLYYIQGFHIAMYEVPLFNEDIIAWQYGPVVPEAYHEFKKFGSGAIEGTVDFNVDFLKTEQVSLIHEIYEVYGQFSAVKLMEMTHNEIPWKSTPINGVISHELMKQYFSTLIVKDGQS